jgi:hypothetical protein
LAAGEELMLELKYAAPSKPGFLVLGFSELVAPFKGGTLWPQPALVTGPLPITQWGTLIVEAHWPSGLPTGFSFWSQIWWKEHAQDWGSSNGLRGVQP